MNNILTIDTSSSQCSIALQSGSKFVQRVSDSQRQSAQRILPMISALLSEAEIDLSQLNLIAVVTGPGSFTGIRIGVAVAQGLGMSQSIPVMPLSSLALLAMAVVDGTSSSHVLVCEEAREGEVYFAAYRQSEELGVELLSREQVAVPESLDLLPESLAVEQWNLVGNGWSKRIEILERLRCSVSSEVSGCRISNRLVSLLANKRSIAGEAIDAEQLQPNYVKLQLNYS